jgi:hypothetical protein
MPRNHRFSVLGAQSAGDAENVSQQVSEGYDLSILSLEARPALRCLFHLGKTARQFSRPLALSEDLGDHNSFQ